MYFLRCFRDSKCSIVLRLLKGLTSWGLWLAQVLQPTSILYVLPYYYGAREEYKN